MVYLVAGVGLLLILIVLGRAFVAADPRALVRTIRYAIGIVLVAVGAVLVLAERWGLALPFIAAGISAISIGRIGPLDLGGSRRSRGTVSTVRSAFLEMRLDHDTGAMQGTVMAGSEAGRSLDDLDEPALMKLRAEVRGDGQSLSLLEAYLDRRVPGWRDDVEGDEDAGSRRAPDAGPMTDEEAYEVLGLAPGASEAEIRSAHRRLMMRMHPDQGGSTFIAAKINEAKDRLIGRRHR
jgi:hypothetical protein